MEVWVHTHPSQTLALIVLIGMFAAGVTYLCRSIYGPERK